MHLHTTSTSYCMSHWHDFWWKQTDARLHPLKRSLPLMCCCKTSFSARLLGSLFIKWWTKLPLMCGNSRLVFWKGRLEGGGEIQQLLHFYWLWIFHLPPMILSLLTCQSQIFEVPITVLLRLSCGTSVSSAKYFTSCALMYRAKYNIFTWFHLLFMGCKSVQDIYTVDTLSMDYLFGSICMW